MLKNNHIPDVVFLLAMLLDSIFEYFTGYHMPELLLAAIALLYAVYMFWWFRGKWLEGEESTSLNKP